MAQLRQYQSTLNELGVLVKIISFDANALALAYIKEVNLPWPLLVDSERLLYQAYGMTHASWWDVYGLTSILKYLKLMFRGFFPGKPGEDWKQLGGDVLIDPSGIVRQIHISHSPHDRPDIETFLRAIQSSMDAD